MTRRGLTLVELLAAMIVLSVVAALIMPITVASMTNLKDAIDQRRALDRASFAMDRVVRMLREAPPSDEGGIAFDIAEAGRFRFADGRGVELLEGSLMQRDAAGELWPLARGVVGFELSFLGADGVTSTAGELAPATWRCEVSLTIEGVELSTAVFVRARLGGAS